jgi:hypothetical protein
MLTSIGKSVWGPLETCPEFTVISFRYPKPPESVWAAELRIKKRKRPTRAANKERWGRECAECLGLRPEEKTFKGQLLLLPDFICWPPKANKVLSARF